MSLLRCERTRANILVFYPCDSLTNELADWGKRHAEYRVERLFVRELSAVRKALCRARIVFVDATDDPAPAADAFSQAVRELGAASVAVYTERSHEGLELFVRVRGAQFLLGPMSGVQWEGLLERMLEPSGRMRPAMSVTGRAEHLPVRATARVELQQHWEEVFLPAHAGQQQE